MPSTVDGSSVSHTANRFWVPAYLGPGGWIGLDLGDGTNWDEVAELVDESYRNTAGKRLIAQLDSRQH